MTPDGIIATAAVRLAAAGIENARGEARLLLAHALRVRRDQTLTVRTITDSQMRRFEEFLARRLKREPLAYITRKREFWSLDFAVGPGVLVPRPDSETLIETALSLFPDRKASLRIGDLGTGSAALLVAALSEFPNATGIGFESSDEAFNWGWHNATVLLPDRAEILLADWSQAQENAFDLIFSNPPYIPSADIESLEPDVRLYEPRAALDGGADGLDAYRGLAQLLPRLLKPGGLAVLELGIGQAGAMETVFQGLHIVEIAPDLAGIPRALVLAKPK